MAIKVFVCGDSFMSRDPNFPGDHFSEMLDTTHVVNLAHPGVGNIDICLQLEDALQKQPDCIIVGTTDPGRIEIPVNKYRGHKFAHFRPGPNQSFISDTIPTLIGEEPGLAEKHDLTTEQRHAVKEYFTHIYHHELKNTVDSWALGYWFGQVSYNKIPLIVLPKDFIIYEYAAKFGNQEPRVFHTDVETQRIAAGIFNEKINSLRV
jgi:hypothetical protein